MAQRRPSRGQSHTRSSENPYMWGVPWVRGLLGPVELSPHLVHRCKGALHCAVPRWVHMPHICIVFYKFLHDSIHIYKLTEFDILVPYSHVDILIHSILVCWDTVLYILSLFQSVNFVTAFRVCFYTVILSVFQHAHLIVDIVYYSLGSSVSPMFVGLTF